MAKPVHILATGRRDPRIYAISLDAALNPANQGTPNAIVSRGKASKDRLDGRPLGDPGNVMLSEDGKKLFVVNHHGAIDNAEFLQHGGRGSLVTLDVKKLVNPDNDNTDRSMVVSFDSGWFGALGLHLLPDMFILGAAESHLTEDGGNRVSLVDRKTGALRGMLELPLRNPGFGCPAFPVPFVSPNGPPSPVAVLSPNASWGCFPDSNGLAVGHGSDGKDYLFTGNGGTDDVSVIDLASALAGNKTPEIARIPVQTGPFGVIASPDGKYIVVAARESQQTGFEGNTISIIDVDLARTGNPGAEVARVLVGTSNPAVSTRPFLPSFTPDGAEIVVPNFRSNNVSIVNFAMALANNPGAEVARIPLVRSADPDAVVRPSRPKGSAVTSDGRYAVVSAGPRVNTPWASGYVYVIDLATRSVVGTVTGVGNDPYGLTVTASDDDDDDHHH